MRAAIRTGLLGTTITFTKDFQAPSSSHSALRPNEVLLHVKSAAINPVDYKLPRLIGGKIIGIDVSGVVDKVGSDVTSFQAGDQVFGRAIDGKGKFSGSLAEYTTANVDEIAKKPEYLQFEEAASLPTAYLTGLQSLRDAGNVKKGSTVLIIGASGGCGIAGVQLAKAIGAGRIVGICSGKNFDFVRSTGGITELVDYTDNDVMQKFLEDNVGVFDCIYDTATGSGAGEDYVSLMMKLLNKDTGKYVQINGNGSDWARTFARRQQPQRTLVMTDKNGKPKLEEIATLLESTGAKPCVIVKPFDEKELEEGFNELKGRRTKGKIVFNIGRDE